MQTNPYAPPKIPDEFRQRSAEKRKLASVWSAIFLAVFACASGPVAITIAWFFFVYLPEPELSKEMKMTEFEKFDTLYGVMPYVTGISVFVGIFAFIWKISQCDAPSGTTPSDRTRAL